MASCMALDILELTWTDFNPWGKDAEEHNITRREVFRNIVSTVPATLRELSIPISPSYEVPEFTESASYVTPVIEHAARRLPHLEHVTLVIARRLTLKSTLR